MTPRSRNTQISAKRQRQIAGSQPSETLASRAVPFAIFIAVSLAIYFVGLRGGFVWDDDSYVTENFQLRSAGGLWRIWTQLGAVAQYYPLVFSTFWVEYHLWGLSPTGYHLVNVLLHGCSAAMIFLFLKQLKPSLALPVALLFAVHPVMVESVQWITERKNTLSMFFYMATLLTLLPMMRAGAADEAGWRVLSWKRYLAALALFICAMLSKTVACTLPATVLVICWYTDGRGWMKRLTAMVPFFAIGLALAAVTVYTEKHIVGTALTNEGLSMTDRLIVAGKALWFYAGKLVFPWPTIFVYPKWNVPEASRLQLIWAFAAAAIMLGAWLLRGKIGRGTATLLFIYAGTLVPALGFVDVYPFKFSYVADHFQYLAAPAFLCVICSAILLLLQRLRATESAGRIVFIAIAIIFGILAARQAYAYRSAEALYRDTIAKNPEASMPLNNLAEILARRGNLDEAEANYRAAIASDPKFTGAMYNLGEILMRKGQAAEGQEYFDKAVALEPDNARLFYHIGLAYSNQRNADLSIAAFQKAIELKPDYIDPLIELGNVYGQTGHPDLAAAEYRKALAMRDDSALAHANLGNALATQGKLPEALVHYRRALDINPQDEQTQQNYQRALAESAKKDGGQ